MTRVASEWRTHFHFVNTCGFNRIHRVFAKQGTCREHGLTIFRIHHIEQGNAPENTLAQGFDDFAALDHGFHHGAIEGATIVLGDHQILCHVDQTSCQIA